MSSGWFYYEGDDNPKPTAEERVGIEQTQSDRLGERLAHLSVEIFATETVVTMGFGGARTTPDEVRELTRTYIRRAIQALEERL